MIAPYALYNKPHHLCCTNQIIQYRALSLREISTMRNLVTFLLLGLALCHALTTVMGYRGNEEEDWWRERQREEEEQEREGRGRYPQGEDWFVLRDSRRVVQTEAGEMRVVRSPGGRILDRQLHMGFITMEPKSLFVPQYIDSSLIIFIRRGPCTSI